MKFSGMTRSIALVAGMSLALVATDAMGQTQGQGQNRRNQQQQQQQQRMQQQRNQQQQNQQQGRGTAENGLKAGQLAPTFTLQSLDGKETFDLREHRGERPVVLIFGSYT